MSRFPFVLAAAFGCALVGFRAGADAPELYRERVELDGIQVDFTITSLEPGGAAGRLREGELVRFEFAIADTATQTPLSGVFPAAWMDRLPLAETTTGKSCVDKVEMFLGGSLLTRAELDLNVYYVLTMNSDPTLSVVDPLFGFGGTQLLAQVDLWAPGRDWALGRDRRSIFVSMPEVDAVAVVDTHTWKVVTNVPTGSRPGRIVPQADGVYLWVGLDGTEDSGVAVLQPANLAERTRIATGPGPHDVAVDGDNRFVYVTNGDGTLSVIDVRRLAVKRTIETGSGPSSIAWSEAAKAIYVSHPDGTLAAVDGERHEVLVRLETEPGLGQVRAAPGGRLVLAVNPEANLLHVIDTSSNTIVQTGPMAGEPDQVAFSDTLAYVRHRDNENVLMVPLAELGRPGAPIPVVDFPGGRQGPGPGGPAPAIVRAPGANAVLVANPADGMVYYYMEGMAAPMGAFQTHGGPGGAVLVVDNSLREARPGAYSTTARLRRPGRYDVAFFLDAPRTVHCFALAVEPDPKLEARRRDLPVQVRSTAEGGKVEGRAGEEVRLVFELIDPRAGGALRAGLEDLEILTLLAPGGWHARHPARDLGGGRYEVRFRPPREGLYYVFASSASAGLEVGSRPVVFVVAGPGEEPKSLVDSP